MTHDAREDNSSTPTPDNQVAQRIVARLLADRLIDSRHVNDILIGLTEGTLRTTDWRLLAEDVLAMEEQHGKGTH